MIRNGSPAACASIVEMTRSNRITKLHPDSSDDRRRLYYAGRTAHPPIPARRLRVQLSSETAPDAEAVSPMPFLEPTVTRDEASALPARLRFKLAAWLRMSGQFDDAAKLLVLIEQEAGESAALLGERAALALAAGDAEGVRACWQRRLAGNPAPS